MNFSIALLEPPLFAGFGFGALYVAMFLTTVYYSVFLTLFPVIFFAILLSLRPESRVFKKGISFALGGLPWIAVLLPFVCPYLDAKEIFGSRALYEMHAFRADGLSYLSSNLLSYFYGTTHTYSHAEAWLFPGAVLLGASIVPIYHCYNAAPIVWHGRATAAAFLLTLVLSSYSEFAFVRQFATPFFMYLSLGFLFLLFYRIGKLERSLEVTYITTRVFYCCVIGIAAVFLLLSTRTNSQER